MHRVTAGSVGLLLAATAMSAVPVAAAEEPCQDARDQVVRWSTDHATGYDKPYVMRISNVRAKVDRTRSFPDDGIVLRCMGRGHLSNGYATKVTFGFRAYDTRWYLFLKRA